MSTATATAMTVRMGLPLSAQYPVSNDSDTEAPYGIRASVNVNGLNGGDPGMGFSEPQGVVVTSLDNIHVTRRADSTEVCNGNIHSHGGSTYNYTVPLAAAEKTAVMEAVDAFRDAVTTMVEATLTPDTQPEE